MGENKELDEIMADMKSGKSTNWRDLKK
jgi:hypothetical protein